MPPTPFWGSICPALTGFCVQYLSRSSMFLAPAVRALLPDKASPR